MANEHYDALCRATIPDLTTLDHLVLGHYCTRFDKARGKAWPPMSELMNISGCARGSVERSKSRLVKRGLLRQITKGNKGTKRCEYAPVMSEINSYSVTGGLHNTPDKVTVETDNVTVETFKGNSPVSNGYPYGDTKPNKPNKPNKRTSSNYDELRFSLNVLSSLPERLSTFLSPSKNFETLLDECDELGITDDVRRVLASNNWDNVTGNPGGIVHKVIKDAIERKRSGQIVIAPIKPTYQPPQFVPENRVIEPMSDTTKLEINALKKKLALCRSNAGTIYLPPSNCEIQMQTFAGFAQSFKIPN